MERSDLRFKGRAPPGISTTLAGNFSIGPTRNASARKRQPLVSRPSPMLTDVVWNWQHSCIAMSAIRSQPRWPMEVEHEQNGCCAGDVRPFQPGLRRGSQGSGEEGRNQECPQPETHGHTTEGDNEARCPHLGIHPAEPGFPMADPDLVIAFLQARPSLPFFSGDGSR